MYPAITGPVAPPNIDGAPENDQPNLDQLKRELDRRAIYLDHLKLQIDGLNPLYDVELLKQKIAEYEANSAEYEAKRVKYQELS